MVISVTLLRSRLVSTPLTSRAFAIALPPSGPSSLEKRMRVVSTPLTTNSASASALPPSGPILFDWHYAERERRGRIMWSDLFAHMSYRL